MLHDLGLLVCSADDGGEALARHKVNVLFTNLQFGDGINGIVLADAARQLQPVVQILFTTGYVEESLSGEQRR